MTESGDPRGVLTGVFEDQPMQLTYRSRLAVAIILTLGIATAVSVFNHASHALTSDSPPITRSLVGSYLAGRFARSANNPHNAARFYRSALARDPQNDVLLEQAFVMEASGANWAHALNYAERLVVKKPDNRLARMLLGLSEFKAKNYKKAREHFKMGSTGPIGELTGAIASAWTHVAEGNSSAALKALQLGQQAEWAKYYLLYHRALVADIAGMKVKAKASYARVYQQDSRTLRVNMAYARHAAHSNDKQTALEILNQSKPVGEDDPHPLVAALRKKIDRDDEIPLLISSPREGLAEVFYGLGDAVSGDGTLGLGLLYLQLALFLEPRHPFALSSLANAYASTDRHGEAISTYNRIPAGSPLHLEIGIRKAYSYNSLENVEAAKKVLKQLIDENPNSIKPLDALGNILRSHKLYSEAVDYFTKAIALIKEPKKSDWAYFYSRGTCYERMKIWSKAEADLLKALELYPDQPLALNYLGYSWVDQNVNLERGLKIIEKAVRLRPDDGYIIDSLGWAHYKLGNYDEAVKHLESAVEKRPHDPILNDHLGDALWRVGRHREARFLWEQALTLKPEPDVREQIVKKLAEGLESKQQVKVLQRTDAGALAK